MGPLSAMRIFRWRRRRPSIHESVTVLPGALALSPSGSLPDVRAVHAEHVDYVWRSLQRLGVREHDLEDELQEVFMVVHRRLHTFDPNTRITTWLFGIALRVAAAYHRRAHRRREVLAADPVSDEQSPGESPEEQTAARQARHRVLEILDRLGLEKRAVFVMFELEELGAAEIASQLGIPIGTVYSRLNAARQEFARALQRLQLRECAGGRR
jgi:RNA polymerase sigma-70 factor, ECF subfamily